MIKAMFKHHPSTLTLLLVLLSGTVTADCHFIGLRSFHIAKNPDVLLWGDLSPLIALEPGHFYPLTPERKDVVQTIHGRVDNLQSQRYYIPRHMINPEGYFSLRFMVIDRDKDTEDDTLLPLTEKLIQLPRDQAPGPNAHPVVVEYAPFADIYPDQPNQMRFEFEILSRPGDCDASSDAGKMADLQHRRQNELKRLLVRVVGFERPGLAGGREYLAYRQPELKSRKLPDGLEKARDVADVNTRELVALGSDLYNLRGTKGFPEVWEEYVLLVQRLYSQRISVLYNENGEQRRTELPSLSLHPGWANLGKQQVSEKLPEDWKILLPAE